MSSRSTHGARPSRRDVLTGSLGAGGGLVLALAFGERLRAEVVDRPTLGSVDFAPNAFLHIGADGSITFFAKHDEMGQGIHTGLAIVLCEDLEVDPHELRVLPAPADAAYGHSAYGLQMTGGSTSTWSSYEQMREAGAVAREMLVQAAAARWDVDPGDCEARDGSVYRRDDSASATYGELAAEAAALPLPGSVRVKDSASFTRIGNPTPRVDSPAKVRGTATFGLDQRMPGMVTAVIERCPYFGGSLKSVDASDAEAMPGVRAVVRVPAGVAVVAEGYWPAYKARAALRVEWDAGESAGLDTERMREEYTALAEQRGLLARTAGDADGVLARAERRLEAVYEVPFQAHVPMEPLNCLVALTDDGGAHVVTGSQWLGGDHPAVAARLGVDLDKVRMENSLLGGGFGRRANPESDFVLDAVEVALAVRELGRPVKTVWSREDDVRGGWYRPMYVNNVAAALEDGRITAWRHRIVGQSIAAGTPFAELMVQDGVDSTSVEGAADMPHGIPNISVELHTVSSPVPVQWWRSVGHSNTAFVKESFLDECAEELGEDPYELRRELLADHPRLLRVLDVAAERADWGRPLPEGVGRGISVHESFRGFAAHVVEASIEAGRPRVRRVVCAIDCGLVINPDQVESQMQGAAIFALSATLGSGITLRNGRVEQSNFHDFQVARMNESPDVDVHIVRNDEELGGIGEVGVPGIASAECSALRAAGGPRIRRLPVADQLV